MNKLEIANAITPILAPIIVTLVKLVLSKLPKWLLPILAALSGVGIDFAYGLATTTYQSNVFIGALLGLAGVGLREVVDQLNKSKSANPPSNS